MSDAPFPKWETFIDAGYYDLSCVRQVGQRAFGEGFHLVNAIEAKALCALLNEIHASPPSPKDNEA